MDAELGNADAEVVGAGVVLLYMLGGGDREYIPDLTGSIASRRRQKTSTLSKGETELMFPVAIEKS